MEEESYRDSPHVYIGFSDLSSDEYNKEKKKYTSKAKQNSFLTKKISTNKQKQSIIKLTSANKTNNIDISDFFNEVNPFPQFNMNCISKRPEIVEKREQESLISQFQKFISLCPQYSYCYEYVYSNIQTVLELLNYIKANGGIESVITNSLFDSFMMKKSDFFSSVEQSKAVYDKYLSAFSQYNDLKQLNYSDDIIKDAINLSRNQSYLMRILSRHHSLLDNELIINTINKNEPLLVYNDYLNFNEVRNYISSIEKSPMLRLKLINHCRNGNGNKIEGDALTLLNYSMNKAYKRKFPICFTINPINYSKMIMTMKKNLPSKLLFESSDNILSYARNKSISNFPTVKIINKDADYTTAPTHVLIKQAFINASSNSKITHWIIPSNQSSQFISYYCTQSSSMQYATGKKLRENGISYYSINQKPNEILIIPSNSIHWYQIKETVSIMTYSLLFIEDLIDVFEEYNRIKDMKEKLPIPFLSILLSVINNQLFSLSLDIVKYINAQINQIIDKEKILLKEMHDIIRMNELSISQEKVYVNDSGYYCEECNEECFNYHIGYSPSQNSLHIVCLSCFHLKIKQSPIRANITLLNQYSDSEIEFLLQRIQFKAVNHYNILDASFKFNSKMHSQYEIYNQPQGAFTASPRRNMPNEVLSLNYTQLPNEEDNDLDLISKSLIELVDAEVFNNRNLHQSPLSYAYNNTTRQFYVDYDTLLYHNNIIMFSPNSYMEHTKPKTRIDNTSIEDKRNENRLLYLIQHGTNNKEANKKDLALIKENSKISQSNRFPGKYLFDFITNETKEDRYEDHAYRAMFNMSYVDHILNQEEFQKNESIKGLLAQGINILSSPFLNEDSLAKAIPMITQSFSHPNFVQQKGLVPFLKELISSLTLTIPENIKHQIKNELLDPIDCHLYY